MKKKGFTLIELLAVIVILAIIALIATPILLNVIENSKKGAAQRSAENYLKAVETAIMEARLDGIKLEDGKYTLEQLEIKLGTIELAGNKPESGHVYIENGQLVDQLSTDATKKTTILVGEYEVSYDATNGLYVSIKKITDNKTCKLVNDFNGDGLGFGDEYLCDPGDGESRTFFVVEDGDTTTLTKTSSTQHSAAKKYGTTGKGEVSLLAKQRFGSRTRLSNVLTVLNTETSDWTDVEVKLPTYHQIKIANGNKENLYPEWLKSVELRFWTSTESNESGLKNYFYVIGNAYFELYEDGENFKFYVVPVITISKDQLG